MSKQKWLKRSSNMENFKFKEFFKKYKLTLNDFAEASGYSHIGVIKMIKRGTIKRPLIKILERKYKDVAKFIK